MKQAIAAMFIVVAFAYPIFAADPVLSVTSGTGGVPAPDTSHGWEFVVNEAITVTHLGLYDGGNDGMDIDHPIGVFRLSDSELLTSGTIHAGAGDTLIDNFRYVDTPDLVLDVDETYVISFYSSTGSFDLVLTEVSGLVVDPVITRAPYARWEESTGGLVLPSNYGDDLDPDRIGPNFLFTPVPEPTTLSLLGLGSLALVMARRRR